jgi:hypothetical protein
MAEEITMQERTLSVYAAADWGAKLIGVVLVHRDAAGALFIGDVPVSTVQVSGHFSVLHGSDGRSHVVLSSFLRLLSAPPRAQA